jgi:hypothetical protein
MMMSLGPVTFQAVRPTFKANPQGGQASVVPASIPVEQLQTQQPQYMKPFKPGLGARIVAFFASLGQTIKGAFSGFLYGTAVGGTAALAAKIASHGKDGLSKTSLGKVILGASVLGGTLAGAFIGKQKVSDSIKGAGVGLMYGAAGGVTGTIAALTMKALNKGSMGKGIFAAATISSTLLGAYIGKLHGNKATGDVYDAFGRSKWSTGK